MIIKDYKNAINDYTKVIQIKNNDAEAYLNRGQSEINIGIF